MRSPKYLVLLEAVGGTAHDKKIVPRYTKREADMLAQRPPEGYRFYMMWQYNPVSGIYDVVEG
jgi:hypothetical protein